MPILSPQSAPADHTGPAWRSAAAAALLAALVLLPLLGHRVLTAWDEGIYAEIAREMLAAHRPAAWIVPHWNGAPWFEKPPLALWLMALSMRVFGLNAFAARLPSALASVATVTVLHIWLRRRFATDVAWLGTALLLACFGFQHAARAGETDSLLTLFCSLGLLGLAEAFAAHPRGWLLFWAGIGCAFLTKGAAALPLLLTPLFLFVETATNRSRIGGQIPGTPFLPRSFFYGLPLCLLVAGAWPLALGWHFGHPFWAEFLGLHTLARATTTLEGHRTSPLFYLKVLLVSAPPFALLYPAAMVAAWRQRNAVTRPLLPFLGFVLLELCLFSAARTRLPHYIDPAYPSLSALLAVWLAPWVRGRPPHRPWHSPVARWVALAALFAVGAAATTRVRSHLHTARQPNGDLTPDNRESAALLQRALRSNNSLPTGPLLVWHTTPGTPFTTDAFYSQRLVRQLPGVPALPGAREDRYRTALALHTSLPAAPHLLLLDRDLLAKLPPSLHFTALATGSQQVVGVVTAQAGR